jgi:polysaccharide biosynthesis protein PslG
VTVLPERFNLDAMKLNSVIAACLFPLTCAAADVPERVLPGGVGVNIHFVTGHEKDLDLIAAAGFKFIRMDFVWSSIEAVKGEYNWSGYEELLKNVDRRGIRALFILDYSNGLYENENASPQHPESVAAFARWAGAAARHFQGRRVIWEIWNEPNINFWKPKPDGLQYTSLALATCKAVREADPQATLIAPASSGFPWGFFEALFKSGILEYLDAVSVHPYREYKHGPETAAADYSRLRELIDRHAPAEKKGKIPILSGEWGYATHRKGVSLETQAAFAARQQLVNLLEGVPLSIWYDWKNDGTDPNDPEHNFGIVLPELQPKPSYRAIQTLTRELAGCRIRKRIVLANDQDYVLVCADGGGKQRLAAWTSGEAHSTILKLSGGTESQLRVVDGFGTVLPVKVDAGRLTLELKPIPQYVALGEALVQE